jgi:hypothetical protein
MLIAMKERCPGPLEADRAYWRAIDSRGAIPCDWRARWPRRTASAIGFQPRRANANPARLNVARFASIPKNDHGGMLRTP